jgi:hypothetical protein
MEQRPRVLAAWRAMRVDCLGLGMGLRFAMPYQAWWHTMNDFAMEDISNIALLCFLLGIGFITFIGVAAIYITSLFLMESFNDGN